MKDSRRKDSLMSRTRITRALVIFGATALGCLVGACTEDDPCDDGQILVNGWCDLAPVDAAVPAPTSDAAVANTAGPEVGGEAGGTGATFGSTCKTSAECAAPADYCANPPGNCTATGCELNPGVCPATWTCMDLTPFGVALHICVPPM
jgi:hypothetical protein